jgi:hypothetical protein
MELLALASGGGLERLRQVVGEDRRAADPLDEQAARREGVASSAFSGSSPITAPGAKLRCR